jgi:hypothetical protein
MTSTESGPIDRRALVDRHRVEITEPHPEHVLSVGNGDFAFGADITGMQTFTAFHTVSGDMRQMRSAVNTTTMSNWGWHEMPNPDGYVLEDTMTTYETARGPVSYPDKHDMMGGLTGDVPDEFRAGLWLHVNPHRADLGRIGFELRERPDAEPETDPAVLGDPRQSLDLWTGTISSAFGYGGARVRVETVASPSDSTVAFRVTSPLLTDGRARIAFRFPYPSDGFLQTDDWDAADRHTSTLAVGERVIRRVVDGLVYTVHVSATNGRLARTGIHEFALEGPDESVELVVRFAPDDADAGTLPSFDEVASAASTAWREFWESGAAIDLSASADPRGPELERRIVLSQYLSRALGAGSLPPAETGLVTNSWQGKFHLEMHYWHSAHFAVWGRPELLERSLRWYLTIVEAARATAARQGYPGLRWPKHTAPDGRESPSHIGALLIWQQPHFMHLLELVWQASSAEARAELVARYGATVDETAEFMAAFAEDRDGVFHLGPPVMPAQEFYEARETTDPTFELAYWWWGLNVAQTWRERRGLARRADWQDVQDRLATPGVMNGRYTAVVTDEPLRRDDHPSFLMSLGVVPPTPLIDPAIMLPTLLDTWDDWEWPTAWGWDFPVMAMAATRLGKPALAIDALLRNEPKNHYTAVGHNRQTPGMLPLYLPGNGGLLLAVALMVEAGVFDAAGWTAHTEGFSSFPAGEPYDPRRTPQRLVLREPVDRGNDHPLSADTSIGDWLNHRVGGTLLRALLAQSGGSADSLSSISELPLQRLVPLSQGELSHEAIDAMVAAAAHAASQH